MQDTVAGRLAGLIHNPFVFDDVYCEHQLTELTLVTVDEVMNSSMPFQPIVTHGLRAHVRVGFHRTSYCRTCQYVL